MKKSNFSIEKVFLGSGKFIFIMSYSNIYIQLKRKGRKSL